MCKTHVQMTQQNIFLPANQMMASINDSSTINVKITFYYYYRFSIIHLTPTLRSFSLVEMPLVFILFHCPWKPLSAYVCCSYLRLPASGVGGGGGGVGSCSSRIGAHAHARAHAHTDTTATKNKLRGVPLCRGFGP